ncbi:MAG: S8 family serine peptidase [Solirubrobacterales bacterium]
MTERGSRSSYAVPAALALLAAFSVWCALAPVARAGDGPDFDRYITVRFSDDASASDRAAARAAVGGNYEVSLSGPQLQQISVDRGSVAGAASRLEASSNVEFAVPSGTWKADAGHTPYFNDPMLDQQWALDDYGQIFMSRLTGSGVQSVSGTLGVDIGAPAAWSGVNPGQLAPVRLGVIDTGVAYEHPDLAANIVTGGDFFDGDSDPRDPNGHGTHVASVAAGVANNGIGTAGVDPWAKVMPLRAADEAGNFSWAAIEQAVAYGLAHGVRVFNGSFGGPGNDPAFESLMSDHPEALFVFSAGNGGSDQVGDDHDAASGLGHRYPCDSELPNVICVGASDWTDALAPYSDFGVKSVDVLAPGSSILAAKPCLTPATSADAQGECPYDASDPYAPVGLGGGTYGFQLLTGTSMAAPAVAGTAALVWGKCPGLVAAQVKRAVVGSVDSIVAVRTKVAYGGRLDAGGAIASVANCATAQAATTAWPTPPAQPSSPGTDSGNGSGSGGGSVGGGATTTGLSFQVIRSANARVTHSSAVKFKLRCSAICSASLSAQARGKSRTFKSFKLALPQHAASTRTVSVKLSNSTLRSVRALVKKKQSVRVKVSLVVTDAAAASSSPTVFSIPLTR